MNHLRALIIALVAMTFSANASVRYERSINSNWTYIKEGAEETVSFPHCINAEDCRDDNPGFWRGQVTYKKTIAINDNLDGMRVYARFEAAAQKLELFVNGRSAGRHVGGYTAFIFEITEFIHRGDNQFTIQLDNSHDPDIPPLLADFTFFGGVYRDVSLVFVPDNHISVSHYATSGVYISTPVVDDSSARVSIETHLTLSQAQKGLRLEHVLTDPQGREVSKIMTRPKRLPAGDDIILKDSCILMSPMLWDISSPQLYSVRTSLVDSKGVVLDSVINTFGIRYFHFDKEKGFFLNGRHVKLMGTNRHQDFKDIGNALPDEMHRRDVRLLKEMGGNFLRIAHYPQDPVISQTCDYLGIVSSEEIPIVDYISPGDTFKDNCANMATEMVYQGYNHPSRIIWAYMNEAMIVLPWKQPGATISEESYLGSLRECARAIDEAIRKADPSRPTMIPCHNSPQMYKSSGVCDFADLIGFNLYCGWYSGTLESFGATLDRIHRLFPDQGLLLTEYGADQDARLHSFEPQRFDYTCDYGMKYHQSYIPVIMSKGYLCGSNVWNINDFYSEIRGYAVPHVNCKGLTGLDRTPKDTYWLYKAWLTQAPFVKISGHDWLIRGGQESGDGYCTQEVMVLSNGNSVELVHNGKSLGVRECVERCAKFDVPFSAGTNILVARVDNGAQDMLEIDFRLVPQDLSAFEEINVMLGSRRYFEDRPGGRVWIPEQPYRPGSWGYIGGGPFMPKTNRGFIPCSENNILGTGLDPIYQTQRTGIEAFKADIPDGKYYIYLYFAELSSSQDGTAIPYSLGNDVIAEPETERVFNVYINGTQVLYAFDVRAEEGCNRAVMKRFVLDVSGGTGLDIEFEALKGSPVLNAVSISRAW